MYIKCESTSQEVAMLRRHISTVTHNTWEFGDFTLILRVVEHSCEIKGDIIKQGLTLTLVGICFHTTRC